MALNFKFEKGPVAVVTGGNSGIGEAIVHLLAKRDYNVLVAGRRAEENERVAADADGLGSGQIVPFQADVSREADCLRLIEAATSGGQGLQLLVNNAGIVGSQPIVETTTEAFDQMMKTNLYSAYWCSREAFRIMQDQPQEEGSGLRGSILNTSSLCGLDAWAGTSLYATSKHGMVGLTRALADEGAEKMIRVASLCPAMVATPMTGVSGPDYLSTEDIAGTVAYLLDLSSAAWPREIEIPRRGA